MPRYIPETNYGRVEYEGKRRLSLPKPAFEKFNISVLGLGDVAAPSTPTDAIAAVFDLAGFTNFCKQIEPQLSVPHYLHSFLNWLLEQVRDEMRERDHDNNVVLWSHLPFFVKFLGDGLLVLWDCAQMSFTVQRNVVLSTYIICNKYRSKFLPTLKTKIVEPPHALRCGVARGTVFSVGDGQDYVGSCINMAARLQKLPGISFCFNRRGFDLEKKPIGQFFEKEIAFCEVGIRGIGDHELVCVVRSELNSMAPRDKKIYKELA